MGQSRPVGVLLAGACVVVAMFALGCGARPVVGDAADAEIDARDGDTPMDAVPSDVASDSAADVRRDPCEGVSSERIDTIAMLQESRYSLGGAVLADGRALILGGYDFRFGVQQSALLIDVVARTSVETGMLVEPRNFPAVTMLRDSRVLVVGGFDQATGSLNGLEIFDPPTGTFRMSAARMTVGREAHTATTLPDGRVLIVGGLQARGFRFHATAQIFDPATDRLESTVGAMAAPRGFHAAAWIASRASVLVVGGDSGMGELATAERWEVSSGRFVATAGPRARTGKAVAGVTLIDGRVLVTGGSNATEGTLADADLYDATSDRFVPTGAMTTRRMAHAIAILPDGRVLASDGWSDSTMPAASSDTIEIYDPAAGTWRALPFRMAQGRHDHVMLAVDRCHVVIAGGQRAMMGSMTPSGPREIEVVTIPPRP